MKEHPILFSGEMAKAILEGRKTQTRRIVKPQPSEGLCTQRITTGDGITFEAEATEQDWKCPYGIIGQRLWVRETWQETTWMHPSDENYGYIYRASENGKAWEDNYEDFTWRPSIHMPRKASRITLEITNIRVERVQDITREGALAEGIKFHEGFEGFCIGEGFKMKCFHASNPIISFIKLWDEINGKRTSWDSNPWVWVIEFKRIV